MKNAFRRGMVAVVMVCMTGMGLPIQAHAGIVSTQSVSASAARHRIELMLERADVRKQLEADGVNPADVQARVNALTNQQVTKLATEMNRLPAGGDGLIGALVFVFLVLLVTDILGLTKVFPFTRPIRR